VERALAGAPMEALYLILDYKRIVLSKITQESAVSPLIVSLQLQVSPGL